MGKHKAIKCLVWDLDRTVWDGILMESAEVHLRPGVLGALRTLDERGILHSIASRNHHDDARRRLEALGLWDYFLYPQIHWDSKVGSLRTIAKELNLGLDALAFVDDDPFERESVAFSLPEVMCIDAAQVPELVHLPELCPRFVTEDSRLRRKMYRDDAQRRVAEEQWVGTDEGFLATLGMRFRIARAQRADLQRAEELTVRTNQLNSTGVTYSYEQLERLLDSPDHSLWIASLEDRFGSMGRIGLALVERGREVWTISLLLMSCRVMARGVGSVLLNFIIGQAYAAGVRLRADFIPNDRNRTMAVTYAFAGFKKVTEHERIHVMELAEPRPQVPPGYLELELDQ